MPKVNVLVVDDEADILDVIGQFLSKHGYRTDLAASVEDAVDFLQDNDYQIILTDKNMPDSAGRMEGGMTLLRYARTHAPNSEIIMITGHATVDTAVEAMKLGAFDYVMKPIPLQELKEKVDRIVEYRRFINSADALGQYRTLHQQMLQLLQNRDDLPEEQLRATLKLLGGRIDEVFGLQRNYESIIQNQSDALEEIETIAAAMIETLPEDSPYLPMAEKICTSAAKRV